MSKDNGLITPGHGELRMIFRVLGPVLIVAGVALMVTTFINFFSVFGDFTAGPPRLFWCFFLGAPLFVVGGVLSSYGFMGAVARYSAQEIAPVSRDTINYVAQGVEPAVTTVARAIKEGLSENGGSAEVRCPACAEMNDSDARFCKDCGAVLCTSRICSKCGKENDAEAKFCDQCGVRLT